MELSGKPSLVSYVAVYPSSASLPTKERIVERATALVELYPLLKACVLDARTTSPRWGILLAADFGAGLANLIADVSIQDVETCGQESTENSTPDISRTLETIFTKELHDQQSIGVSRNGLLWRVVRYCSGVDSTPDNDQRPAYIVLTCNHVISDGRSGQALLGALLSEEGLKPMGKEKSGIAPSMQATINCRPSLGFMLHQVWYEVIVPKLPRSLGRNLKMKPCWPGAPPFSHDPDRKKERGRLAFQHIHLSVETLKCLKDRGKANDIRTLHPILQIAAAVALWILIPNSPRKQNNSAICNGSLCIRHGCAVSHCQSALDHPPITGNFIGVLDGDTTFPDDGNVDFWRTVRDYATRLHSPTLRHRGCQVMGSLRFIPDGVKDPAEDSIRPTGWEAFFLDRSEREPTESFSSSNLGFYKRPSGSIRLAWSQTTVLDIPAQISIIGHDAGVDIDISRPVGAWIDEFGYEPLEHFAAMYEKVLRVLAITHQGTNEAERESELTFRDVQRMTRRE